MSIMKKIGMTVAAGIAALTMYCGNADVAGARGSGEVLAKNDAVVGDAIVNVEAMPDQSPVKID